MKKLLITFLKLGVSVAIIAFLVYRASRGDVFANLRDEPKQWDVLALAWLCCAVAVLITFVRWWYLVRALDVPCRFNDAIRISFWGYLFNLMPLGIVGGDLVKTLMLGHEQPRYRAKALASVLVDRVIGLYVLFLVCTVAILLTGFLRIGLGSYWWICPAMFAVTLVSTIGLAFVLGPERMVSRAIATAARIPRVGCHLESLIHAVRMYRRRPRVLILAALSTVAVHSLFSVGCYLIACGLQGNHRNHPALGQHFVVFPLSAALQVIPIPLGPTESALDFLYASVPPPIGNGPGLVVALAYRLIMLLIALLGLFYYLANRREMAEVIHEAEQEDLAEPEAERA